MYVFVYVIARAGVKFGINFTSCSGTAILPSSLQQVNLSQNFTPVRAITNYTRASFVKVKISDCQTRFHDE